MLLAELRNEVASYAKKMYESHLVRATQGNLSARDRASGLICLTPSGVDYQSLTAEDIVVVDLDGKVVEGHYKPTSELPLHTAILRQRSDIHSVMHTHSPYATAFGIVYQAVPVVLADSALYLGSEVPVMPYQQSGTEAFAQRAVEALGQGLALIWGNHGAMVAGVNLAHAFSAAHALEDNAQIYILARHLGSPMLLPPNEIKKLQQVWRKKTQEV
jgi:L-ribulose-5-phosphate 4-epimerase